MIQGPPEIVEGGHDSLYPQPFEPQERRKEQKRKKERKTKD
jgi:hypothetical protein